MQTETFTLGPLTMYVSEDHRFGTDAFLLAYYANVKPDSVVCDLCTGCGIIPLIFCKNVKPHLIYAVDIQEEAIELLKMSVEKNHLENRLQPVLADLRELKQSQIGFETMDIVTANPPYMTSGSGFEKLARPQAVAREQNRAEEHYVRVQQHSRQAVAVPRDRKEGREVRHDRREAHDTAQRR